jgi:type VI secretion system protein ImpJ
MSDAPMGIHWREGLFLRPHHLQQLVLYTQGSLAKGLDACLPFRWGLMALDLDPLRLEEGVFQVRTLEVVLPSGEIARVSPDGGSNAVVQSREIPTVREQRLRVYAGVRRLRDQEANCGESSGSGAATGASEEDPPRYFRTSMPVHDLTSGRNRVDLEFEKINVRIFFEGDRMEGFETVPLAELVPQAVGLPLRKLSKTFVPPCLRVDANQVLHQFIREVYMEAASKGAELGSAIDAGDLMAGNATEAEFLQIWKLFTLRGALPTLREAADGGFAHPYDLYLALLRLQGQFAALTPGSKAPDLPRYDPMDAGTCFDSVCSAILELLRGDEGPAGFKRIDLRRGALPVGGAAAAAQGIPPDWLEVRNTVYLVFANPESGGKDRDWYRSGHVKAGAVSRIATIVTTRQMGIQLVACEKPRALPSRPNGLYYKLETRNAARPEMRAEWDAVCQERSLAFHFATEGLGPESAGADPDFEAYVVFGR